MSIRCLVIHSGVYDDLNLGTTQYPIDNSSQHTYTLSRALCDAVKALPTLHN